MKLIGLMPVRNEAWVLGLSARVALMWCDSVVFLDHASEDASPKILDDLQGEYGYPRVIICNESSKHWPEMEHRQLMLEVARRHGATHIALIDADEVLTGNLLDGKTWRSGNSTNEEIKRILSGQLLELPGYNLRNGIQQYHGDGIWGRRWFSLVFKDDPELGWHGDRHDHREPMGKQLTSYRPISHGNGGVMHLWGASERRLIAKHALYKVNHRLRFPEKPIATIEKEFSWAIKGEIGHPSFGTSETWHYNAIPEAWWAPYAGLMKYLDVDAEPWQECEVQRLVSEHGKEAFAGLDLFGVA